MGSCNATLLWKSSIAHVCDVLWLRMRGLARCAGILTRCHFFVVKGVELFNIPCIAWIGTLACIDPIALARMRAWNDAMSLTYTLHSVLPVFMVVVELRSCHCPTQVLSVYA